MRKSQEATSQGAYQKWTQPLARGRISILLKAVQGGFRAAMPGSPGATVQDVLGALL